MNDSLVKGTYAVSGMSCASCASSLTATLSHTKGVVDVSINFANKTASIRYNSSITSPEQLQQATKSIGFELIIDSLDNIQETSDQLQDKYIHNLQNQTLGALVLSLPLVIIAMFFMNIPYANPIMLLLSSPVLFFFGFTFFSNAWKQALHRQTSMDTLVALSTGSAYLFSVFNTFFPEFWQSKGMQAHVYFESAAVIISFVSLGKWMEEKAKSRTSNAIKKLMGLQSKYVRVIDTNGTENEVEIKYVKRNDILLVKPGEKIPVDGILVEGNSSVDEASISGEAIPAEKNIGDKVYAGTINQQGVFRMCASSTANDSLLAHIIKMVQEAQGSKAPVQKLVDKISAVFVPTVLGIAFLTFAIWLLSGVENAFSHGLLSALTVLIIACPCALGLATPTSIMVGIGKAAEDNILIKDAESMETACQTQIIVFDKTGTITEGKPSVQKIFWVRDPYDPYLLDCLYTIAYSSSHPLAQAISKELEKFNPKLLPLSAYENISGKGAFATLAGVQYFMGNTVLMKEHSIHVPISIEEQIKNSLLSAQTIVCFAKENEMIAVISLSDRIKAHSIEAIAALQKQGMELYMLTGDHAESAQAVAKKVGINHYRSQMLPSDKADFIKQLQASGKKVAMVGDGINDSQALAQADISIAMGKGSDIAIDLAKITLLSSNLLTLSQAFLWSKKTVHTIRQNLFWAFIYNLIGIPIAAGILYPIWGITLNPMIAGASMALSSVSVVANSLRLKLVAN